MFIFTLSFSRSDTRRRFRGFTLIELLVVICIIALLAAILFPVFGRARENARRSSCQNNLKQMGIGLFQYQQDYDETVVLFRYDPVSNLVALESNPKWMDSVQPYLQNTQVFNCPSVSSKFDFQPLGVRTTTSNTCGSYAMNFGFLDVTSLNASPPVSDAFRVLKMAQIADSTGTAWVMDNRTEQTPSILTPTYDYAIWWYDNTTTEPVVLNNAKPPQLQGFDGTGVAARHMDTINVLFCDGHVKAMKLDTLAAKKNIGGKMIATMFTIEDD